MRRLDYNDGEDGDDFQDENFFSGEDVPDDGPDFEHAETMDLMQLEMVETDLKQRLLFKSIAMLEKSWFWRFRSTASRLRKIRAVYEALGEILIFTENHG